MSEDAHEKLPQHAFKAALNAVTAWQHAPDVLVACPVCGALGLVVADRSARPYTAWFDLRCGQCGLADTITYPLGGSGGSWSA